MDRDQGNNRHRRKDQKGGSSKTSDTKKRRPRKSEPKDDNSKPSVPEDPTEDPRSSFRNVFERMEFSLQSLPLKALTKHINPCIIPHYLEKIDFFLKSPKRVLLFPMVSPYLDGLLVRMIRDQHNLRSLMGFLNAKTRVLVVEIMKTLKENAEVFILVHSYDGSRSDMTILIYKKMFMEHTCCHQDPQHKCCSHKTSSDIEVAEPVPLPAPNATTTFKPKWLTTMSLFIKDMNCMFAEFPDLTTDEAQMLALVIKHPKVEVRRLDWLWLAIQHIQSTHEIAIYYRNVGTTITLMLEKYALRKARSSEEDGCSAIPDYEDHDDFDNTDPRMVVLPIQLTEEADASDRPSNAPQDPVPLSKTQRAFNKKKELVELVGPKFTESAFRMINKFIRVATEKSLVFNNTTDEQSLLLQSVCSMIKNKRMHALFNDESQALLKQIGQELVNCNFGLSVERLGLDKYNKRRTIVSKEPLATQPGTAVTAQKAPTGIPTGTATARKALTETQTGSTEDSGARVTDNARRDNRKTLKDLAKAKDQAKVLTDILTLSPSEIFDYDVSTGQYYLKSTEKFATISNVYRTLSDGKDTSTDDSLSIASSKINAATSPRNKSDRCSKVSSSTAVATAKAVTSVPSTTKASAATISTSSYDITTDRPAPATLASTTKGAKTAAVAMTIEKKASQPLTSASSSRPVVSDGRSFSARKAKLLEDMSGPVASDREMEIMREMGFEEGPVGVRGEGITEPSLSDLQIVSDRDDYAKSKSDALSAQSKSFRLDVLKNIRILLIEAPLKKTLIYPYTINKKEKGFLLNTVRALSKRSMLQMNDKELEDAVKLVIEEMLRKPQQHLYATLHDDQKSITISKNDVYKTHPIELPPPPPEAVTAVIAKYGRCNYIHISTVTQIGQMLDYNANSKSAKGIGHRIIILAKILELLKGDKFSIWLRFEYSMTIRQVHYAKHVVTSVNLRTKIKNTPHENYLYNDIMEVIGDLHLSLEFGNINMSLTIQKKRSKRMKLLFLAEKGKKNSSINNNDKRVLSRESIKSNEDEDNDTTEVATNESDDVTLHTDSKDAVGATTKHGDKPAKDTDRRIVKDISSKPIKKEIKNDAKIVEEPLVKITQRDLAQTTEKEVAKIVEEPLAKITQRDLAQTTEKEVAKIVEEPLAKITQRDLAQTTEKEVAKIVEEPLAKITQRDLALTTEKEVAKIVEEPLAKITQRDLAQTTKKEVAKIVEEPLAKITQRDLAQTTKKEVAKIVEEPLAKITQRDLAQTTEKEVAKIVEEPLAKITQRDLALTTEKEVAKIVEEPLAKITQRDLAQTTDKEVAKIVEEPLAKITQRDLAQTTEKEVAKIVEEPLAKITQRDLAQTTEKVVAEDVVSKLTITDISITEVAAAKMPEKYADTVDTAVAKLADMELEKTTKNDTAKTPNEDDDADFIFESTEETFEKFTDNIEEEDFIKLDDDFTKISENIHVEKTNNREKVTDKDVAMTTDKTVTEMNTKSVSSETVDEKNEESNRKRVRTDSMKMSQMRKTTKLQAPTYLCFGPMNYPEEEINLDMIKDFQKIICDKLNKTKAKPLIQCLGVKYGALLYGCHNENGRILVESVADEMNFSSINVTRLYNNQKAYVVHARINTYLNINPKKLFDDLEKYNYGLKTNFWIITDVQKKNECMLMMIEVDWKSYRYISRNDYALFAGMDKVTFCGVCN